MKDSKCIYCDRPTAADSSCLCHPCRLKQIAPLDFGTLLENFGLNRPDSEWAIRKAKEKKDEDTI